MSEKKAASSSSEDALFVDPLQIKIKNFLEKAKTVNLLENLKSQRQFHNPEILNKIMKEFSLSDEYGTNTPEHLYTPVGKCNNLSKMLLLISNVDYLVDLNNYKELCKKRQQDQEKQNFIQMQKAKYRK